jgi:hypothetical protein
VFGGSEYNPYLRSASESGAPSLRRAGSDPFRRAYEDQLGAQYGTLRTIGRSAAEARAAEYGATPSNPQNRQSFGDGLVQGLAKEAPGLISSALGGLFGRSSSGSFSSSVPWNFNTGLNFLPSGSSGTSTNFSANALSGPSFTPTSLNFLN